MKVYFARHGYHIPTETFFRANRAKRLVSYADDQASLVLDYHKGPDKPPRPRTAKKPVPPEERSCL